MNILIKHLLCCLFLSTICTNIQSNDMITKIAGDFREGVPSKEIRRELDAVIVSSLSDDEKQKYYKLSSIINMRLKHNGKANQDLIQLLKLQLNDRERKSAVNMISRNIVMSDHAENITNTYRKIKIMLPDVCNREIWFGIFKCLYDRNDENFISIVNDTLSEVDRESNAYIRYVLAMYLSRKQEYKQSAKICNELLKDGRKIFSEEEIINIQFLLAYSLAHNHDIDDAISEFTRLLECNNKKMKAKSYLGLGYCFAEKKEYEKAIMNYKKAKEESSNFGLKIIEEANRAIKKIQNAQKDRK